jgi:hypothetical protein
MMQRAEPPLPNGRDETTDRPEAEAEDAPTPFDNELELWIVASST